MDKFIFLHVMKTGGTSIRFSFEESFGGNMLVDYAYRHDRTKGRGLLSFKKSLTIYPENYETYKVIFGHFNYNKYAHLNRPFLTFLRDPITRVESHYARNWNNNIRFKLEDFCKITSNIMTFMTGGDLSKFSFIGITEKFPESVERLSKILGIQLYMHKENVTKTKYYFNKKEKELVRSYNLNDIELYKQALDIFQKGR
jgi:hypothetical protein